MACIGVQKRGHERCSTAEMSNVAAGMIEISIASRKAGTIARPFDAWTDIDPVLGETNMSARHTEEYSQPLFLCSARKHSALLSRS